MSCFDAYGNPSPPGRDELSLSLRAAGGCPPSSPLEAEERDLGGGQYRCQPHTYQPTHAATSPSLPPAWTPPQLLLPRIFPSSCLESSSHLRCARLDPLLFPLTPSLQDTSLFSLPSPWPALPPPSFVLSFSFVFKPSVPTSTVLFLSLRPLPLFKSPPPHLHAGRLSWSVYAAGTYSLSLLCNRVNLLSRPSLLRVFPCEPSLLCVRPPGVGVIGMDSSLPHSVELGRQVVLLAHTLDKYGNVVENTESLRQTTLGGAVRHPTTSHLSQPSPSQPRQCTLAADHALPSLLHIRPLTLSLPPPARPPAPPPSLLPQHSDIALSLSRVLPGGRIASVSSNTYPQPARQHRAGPAAPWRRSAIHSLPQSRRRLW